MLLPNNRPIFRTDVATFKFLVRFVCCWCIFLYFGFILTKREKEVFDLLISSKTTVEIAKILEISEKTVRNHISNVMQKLGVKGRAAAVVELLKIGEISL